MATKWLRPFLAVFLSLIEFPTTQAAEHWQSVEVGIGSATIFGNIRAQWPLGALKLPTGDKLALTLMHTLIPVGDSARSLFEVPQLSSWIAEVEPGRLTWKPPYFQRRQFSMREGKWKSALNDATLIEETSPTTWQVQDKNGDHYFYNEGELRRATIGGSEIGFESSHGLISRIFQVSNNHSLLSAGYDQSGRILTISTEGGNLRFIWLNQLLTKVVVDNAAPLRFSYRSDLLLSVEDRMGVFRCFWRENPYALKGYSALSSLVLISNDGNNDYMYDIRNSVLSLRVKNKDGYVSEMQFLSRSGRVRAVR